MTVASPFFSSCHGEYGCFIQGLLSCAGWVSKGVEMVLE